MCPCSPLLNSIPNHLLVFWINKFSFQTGTPSGYENRFAVSTSARETDAALPGRDIYRASLTQTSAITRSEAKIVTLFLKVNSTDLMDGGLPMSSF
jgi:hypothetical protein